MPARCRTPAAGFLFAAFLVSNNLPLEGDISMPEIAAGLISLALLGLVTIAVWEGLS